MGAGAPAAAGEAIRERQPGPIAAGVGRGDAAVPVLNVQSLPGGELRAVGRRRAALFRVQGRHHQRVGLPGVGAVAALPLRVALPSLPLLGPLGGRAPPEDRRLRAMNPTDNDSWAEINIF